MKKILQKTLLVSIIVLLFPFVLTLLISKQGNNDSKDTMDFTIYYEVNGSKVALSFDDYLLGVVAANMPAGYQMEALKAQAVIARTYALYNITLLSKEVTSKNFFTTTELGLSYIGLNDLEQYWGSEDYNSYFTRLENAVYATRGKILIYKNDLIFPVFFNTGSGYTRNASEAWGIEVPYLVSVPSKQDVTSINYLSIEEYALSEIVSTISKYYTDLDVTEKNFFEKVKVTERDSAGYVLKINLGNLTVTGEELSKVLGLSSNHFYIEDYGGSVRIICNGAGHGVGLSQYGANAMAEDGFSYGEILEYYYSGISLANLSDYE